MLCDECYEPFTEDELFMGICHDCWEKIQEEHRLGVIPFDKVKDFDDSTRDGE